MDSRALAESKPSGDGSPLAEDQPEASHQLEDLAGGVEAEETAGIGDDADEKVLEEVEEVEEEKKPKQGRKKRAVDKGGEEGTAEKEQGSQPAASEAATPVRRPSRERKPVERFSDMSLQTQSTSASKKLSIQQGPGTMLKDIPNVLFKVSKRKSDDTLQDLHTILFGRKSNVYSLKRNILQFSGFVWSENKEKEESRVKGKLDKFKKEKLFDLCDLLDIHAVKSTTRKEEVTKQLFEFLGSPSVTRDAVLSEKLEKGKKKKWEKGTSGKSSDGGSTERQTKRQRKSGKQAADEEDDEGGAADTKDATDDKDNENSRDEKEHPKSKQLDEEDEEEEPPATSGRSYGKQTEQIVKSSKVKPAASTAGGVSSNKSQLKPSRHRVKAKDELSSPGESKKGSAKELTKKGSRASTKDKSAANIKDSAKVSKSTPESSSRKNVTVGDKKSGSKSTSKGNKDGKKKSQTTEIPSTKKNNSAKSESKVSKQKGKTKASVDTNTGPSTEELHAVTSDILNEVDFNTATLADILRQLEAHFNIGLMDRKAEIKNIIEDVINNMPDYDVDEDEGDPEDLEAGAEDDNGAKDDSDGDGDK